LWTARWRSAHERLSAGQSQVDLPSAAAFHWLPGTSAAAEPAFEETRLHDESHKLLHNLGQSIWLDNITRDPLNSGTL